MNEDKVHSVIAQLYIKYILRYFVYICFRCVPYFFDYIYTFMDILREDLRRKKFKEAMQPK